LTTLLLALPEVWLGTGRQKGRRTDGRIHNESTYCVRHSITAYYSFFDLKRMKGWVGLFGWPVANGLPT